MSARLSKVEFADNDEFELAPRFERGLVEQRFSFARLTREVGELYEELLLAKGVRA